MALTEVERAIAKSVVSTFLLSRESTSHKNLLRVFEDPAAIIHLVNLRILTAWDNPPNYLPTVLAFHYIGDTRILESARTAVDVVVRGLQSLFRGTWESTHTFVSDDLLSVVAPMNVVPSQNQVHLGLFLARDFGANILGGWTTNDRHTEVVTFQISEFIVSVKDAYRMWDDLVRDNSSQIERTANSFEFGDMLSSAKNVTTTLADLKKMPLAHQGRFLLARLVKIYPQTRSAGGLNKHNLLMAGDPHELAADFSHAEESEVRQYLLGLPWTALVNQGYIVDPAGQGFYHLSDEGHKVLEAADSLASQRTRVNVLEEEKLIDAVTGIFQRGELDADLRKNEDRNDSDPPLGFAMIDVDHFKEFNTLHGHPIADKVLRIVAQTLATVVRGKGEAYRYGGDEFSVILPNHNLEEARAVAERIRSEVETARIDSLPDICVTTTVGVASIPDTSENVSHMVADADRVLLEAKGRGRNRVYCASKETSGAPVKQEIDITPMGGLSPDASRLIRAAESADGILISQESGAYGLSAGGEEFLDGTARSAAKWRAILRDLLGRGVFEGTADIGVYQLSAAGYEIADRARALEEDLQQQPATQEAGKELQRGRRQRIRNEIANLFTQGERIRDGIEYSNPSSVIEKADWKIKVQRYLTENLDESYAVRFRSPSQQVTAYPLQMHATMRVHWAEVTAGMAMLSDFMAELRDLN